MRVWKQSVLGYIGGMVYVGMELLWRGWSHGSMFVVGGICFLLIGSIETVFPNMPLVIQSIFGGLLVTTMELLSGLFLNVLLDMHVWDYSSLPMNFMGQVCLSYYFLWIFVSFLAIWADKLLRLSLFREKVFFIRKKRSFPHTV